MILKRYCKKDLPTYRPYFNFLRYGKHRYILGLSDILNGKLGFYNKGSSLDLLTSFQFWCINPKPNPLFSLPTSLLTRCARTCCSRIGLKAQWILIQELTHLLWTQFTKPWFELNNGSRIDFISTCQWVPTSRRQCRLVLLCWGSFVPFAVQCSDLCFSHWWRLLSSVTWTTVTRHWPVFLNLFFGGSSQWWMQLLD